jgi:inner membrane protein
MLLGKKIGRKAILWGGLLGTLPDLDILSGYWMDELSKTEFHRGPSHSLLFAALMAYPIGAGIRFLHHKSELQLSRCALFVFITLLTHILLDLCTTWGTQVFWPFDTTAYAWQIVFVLDPLYTLPFLLALLMSPFLKNPLQLRGRLWKLALFSSTGYLLLCCLSKTLISGSFERSFAQIEEPILSWSSRPAPLNTILWTAIAESDKAFYIAYHSHLDHPDYLSPLFHFPKNEALRKVWDGNPEFERLKTMTKGQFLLEASPHGLLVKDLRFGQSEGWTNPESPFVFQYELHGAPQKTNLIRRIAPSMASRKKALNDLWNRIKGLP